MVDVGDLSADWVGLLQDVAIRFVLEAGVEVFAPVPSGEFGRGRRLVGVGAEGLDAFL